jgi:hypothetical protein
VNKSRRVEMLEMRRVQDADKAEARIAKAVMGNGAGVWYSVFARVPGLPRGRSFAVHV